MADPPAYSYVVATASYNSSSSTAKREHELHDLDFHDLALVNLSGSTGLTLNATGHLSALGSLSGGTVIVFGGTGHAAATAAVPGHADVAIDPAGSVFDELQTDARWNRHDSGYNFRHTLDIATNPLATTPGSQLLVALTLPPVSGQLIYHAEKHRSHRFPDPASDDLFGSVAPMAHPGFSDYRGFRGPLSDARGRRWRELRG